MPSNCEILLVIYKNLQKEAPARLDDPGRHWNEDWRQLRRKLCTLCRLVGETESRVVAGKKTRCPTGPSHSQIPPWHPSTHQFAWVSTEDWWATTRHPSRPSTRCHQPDTAPSGRALAPKHSEEFLWIRAGLSVADGSHPRFCISAPVRNPPVWVHDDSGKRETRRK